MEIRENFSLKAYNTFGIAAKAKLFSDVNSLDQLKEVYAHYPTTWRRKQPFIN